MRAVSDIQGPNSSQPSGVLASRALQCPSRLLWGATSTLSLSPFPAIREKNREFLKCPGSELAVLRTRPALRCLSDRPFAPVGSILSLFRLRECLDGCFEFASSLFWGSCVGDVVAPG